MLQKGREVRSRTDYILGMDRRLFGNISVRDPRHNSDHYMVLGFLTSASLTEHKRYLGGVQEVTSEAAEGANKGGRRICVPAEGRHESEGARGETERVDLEGDVETHQQESLRVPEPSERAGTNKTTGTRHQGELGGGLETARGQGGGRGGGAGGGKPTPNPGGLAQDSGVGLPP